MALAKAVLPLLLTAAAVRGNAAPEAQSSIDVAGIYNAVKAGVKGGKDVLARYATDWGEPATVAVMGDWLKSAGVYYFLADMDIDCDGVDWKCAGNTDGDPETSFGALDARVVPWYVLPEQFTDKHTDIQPNALGAIICNGKMFYAVFGDTNGDEPHNVIGEGSLLLGRSCFPNDNISGQNGHDPSDVAYIVFPDAVPSNVRESTIDVNSLKSLGDAQVEKLQAALKLGSGGGGGAVNVGGNPKPRPKPTTTTSKKPTSKPTPKSHHNTKPKPHPSKPTSSAKHCHDDNDCPGSDVCCVYPKMTSSNHCVTLSSCKNEKCKISSSITGKCDGD